MMLRQNKSVTLIELIIAISLVAVIILGVNSINIFSHYQVVSSDRRAKLQNEVAFCLEHMTKHISMAIGDVSNDPIVAYSDNRGIRVRIDDNPANGRVDTTDHWIAYRHIGNQILFFPNATTSGVPSGSSEVLSNRILTTNLGASTDTWGLVFSRDPGDNNLVAIVRARWDPATAVSQDNPQVSMQTSVDLPSVSIN